MIRPSATGRFAAAWVAASALTLDRVPAQTITTVEVRGGNTFSPENVTVQVGDTVRWVWVAGNHNVESGQVVSGLGVYDGNFRSGDPTPIAGTTYDVAFDQALLAAHPMPGNVYPYYCAPHAAVGMIGTVAVAVPIACAADADCDDGDACTTDSCAAGACTNTAIDGCGGPGPQCTTGADCDDGDICTDDLCVLAACRNVVIDACCRSDAECDDGDPCTTDLCGAGVCMATPIDNCGDAGGAETTNGTGTATGVCGAAGMVPLLVLLLGWCGVRFVRPRPWVAGTRRPARAV